MPNRITNTGSATFDNGVVASHATLQSAIAVATTQAAANTASRAHFNTCIALAVVAGISPAVYIEGLRNVGTRA